MLRSGGPATGSPPPRLRPFAVSRDCNRGLIMPIRVALHHKTDYQYDRLVSLSPQIVRLLPAPHCRTPITAYSLKIEPPRYFINWYQGPQSNYVAPFVFPERVKHMSIEVGIVAEG